MKNKLKLLKSVKGTGKDQPSKALPPGTLYVVCKNKPLIALWALSDRSANDYYDSSVPNRRSGYSTTYSPWHGEDRMPVILSQDEEMMLFNEGLSENY
jgi:hypothetical protein